MYAAKVDKKTIVAAHLKAVRAKIAHV
jgi:hypothetical protein